jgi:hypothetical protein
MDTSYFNNSQTSSILTPRKATKQQSTFHNYYNQKLYAKQFSTQQQDRNVPSWATPNHGARARFDNLVRATMPAHLLTPSRQAPPMVGVDRQILGFSFIRTQTTQQRAPNLNKIPSFSIEPQEVFFDVEESPKRPDVHLSKTLPLPVAQKTPDQQHTQRPVKNRQDLFTTPPESPFRGFAGNFDSPTMFRMPPSNSADQREIEVDSPTQLSPTQNNDFIEEEAMEEEDSNLMPFVLDEEELFQ